MVNDKITAKVYIKSVVSDLVMADIVSNAGNDAFCFDQTSGKTYKVDTLKNEVDEVVEYMTEGTISADSSGVTLTYSECQDMGFGNSSTVLSFDYSSPDTVTIIRTGDVEMACRFDPKEKRQICTYNTAGFPFEFAVQTKSVKNCITTKGGTLNLDYIIELHGVKAERNLLRIDVKIPEESSL